MDRIKMVSHFQVNLFLSDKKKEKEKLMPSETWNAVEIISSKWFNCNGNEKILRIIKNEISLVYIKLKRIFYQQFCFF